MTTLTEVARRAGVSKSTASRVFSNPTQVSSAARQRVLDVAKELEYSAPPRGGSVIARRGCTIGLLVPDFSNPRAAPLMKHAQSQSRRMGLSLVMAGSDEHVDDEFVTAEDLVSQVDGLILAAYPRMTDADVTRVAKSVPTILINHVTPGVSSIGFGPEGFEQSVQHLAALGHERICYLSGPSDSQSSRARKAVLVEHTEMAGVELLDIGPSIPRFEAGVRAADLVIASGVTAVVAFNDLMAVGLIRGLRERGVHLGEGISVIGIDDSWLTEMTSPPLSSVRLPWGNAGRMAVTLLKQLLDDPNGPVVNTVLPSELIVRGSSARR